jgi:hypothetical protein
MNNALLDDLKQFIEVRFSQNEARMDERFEAVDARFDQIDKKIDHVRAELRQEMREGFAGVADAMEETNKANDSQFARLKKRVGLA